MLHAGMELVLNVLMVTTLMVLLARPAPQNAVNVTMQLTVIHVLLAISGLCSSEAMPTIV